MESLPPGHPTHARVGGSVRRRGPRRRRYPLPLRPRALAPGGAPSAASHGGGGQVNWPPWRPNSRRGQAGSPVGAGDRYSGSCRGPQQPPRQHDNSGGGTRLHDSVYVGGEWDATRLGRRGARPCRDRRATGGPEVAETRPCPWWSTSW